MCTVIRQYAGVTTIRKNQLGLPPRKRLNKHKLHENNGHFYDVACHNRVMTYDLRHSRTWTTLNRVCRKPGAQNNKCILYIAGTCHLSGIIYNFNRPPPTYHNLFKFAAGVRKCTTPRLIHSHSYRKCKMCR